MKTVFLRFQSFIFQGSIRTIKIKKNVVGLAMLKGTSMMLGFVLLPLTLHYLDPSKYGIWLTLSSVIAWVGFFDIGLSNGLRNKLGEALAVEDKALARTLVSTTLAMLVGIITLVYMFFWLINPFLNWTAILNAPTSMTIEINLLVIIVFSCFALRFVTGLISTVLATDQRPALADSLNTLVSLLSLAVIYVLTVTTKNSLLYMGVSLSVITVLVPLLASLWFFGHDYRLIAPSLHYVDWSQIRGLAGQGIQFFGIQIAALVLFATDNVIITQLFGPAEVVPYNIAYRLFSYVVVAFGLVLTPFWAAYNDAYNKQDLPWMKRATNRMLSLWGLLAIGVTLLFALSSFIYHFWIGDQVAVPVLLSFFMGVYVLVQTFNMIFVTFIFATGKLRVQMYVAIFAGIINIPLCILFGSILGFGPAGVILATAVCGVPNLLLAPIQYHKLIYGQAKGIWAR